mmetsp:Transcript_39923/g.96303  ORF Transcript_39923/g.96303 Transcript_39923/m.96303 type:complete len:141 (-) Transcript_39923:70-492(-)
MRKVTEMNRVGSEMQGLVMRLAREVKDAGGDAASVIADAKTEVESSAGVWIRCQQHEENVVKMREAVAKKQIEVDGLRMLLREAEKPVRGSPNGSPKRLQQRSFIHARRREEALEVEKTAEKSGFFRRRKGGYSERKRRK